MVDIWSSGMTDLVLRLELCKLSSVRPAIHLLLQALRQAQQTPHVVLPQLHILSIHGLRLINPAWGALQGQKLTAGPNADQNHAHAWAAHKFLNGPLPTSCKGIFV